jgi:hypothetical protein
MSDKNCGVRDIDSWFHSIFIFGVLIFIENIIRFCISPDAYNWFQALHGRKFSGFRAILLETASFILIYLTILNMGWGISRLFQFQFKDCMMDNELCIIDRCYKGQLFDGSAYNFRIELILSCLLFFYSRKYFRDSSNIINKEI